MKTRHIMVSQSSIIKTPPIKIDDSIILGFSIDEYTKGTFSVRLEYRYEGLLFSAT